MIARWSYEAHEPMLSRWVKERGIADSAGPADLYPATGFVVDGIAVGFLYRTDAAALGWLDGIVTDPKASKDARATALRVLVTELYAEARRQGVRLVWATTSAPSLVELGKACGAKIYQRNHVCLSWTPR